MFFFSLHFFRKSEAVEREEAKKYGIKMKKGNTQVDGERGKREKSGKATKKRDSEGVKEGRRRER